MKKILHYLIPYSSQMIWGFCIKFTGTVVELALPWILSHMIDEVIPRKDIYQLIPWGVLMLACAVCALVFNVVANRKASKVARDATEKIRNDLFHKIIYLTNHQVDEFTMPSLISRATSDTYNIHQMFGMMQRLGVRAPIMFIGGMAITMILDPVLTLVMISVMPVIVLLFVYISKVGVPMYDVLQQKVDRFVRVVREDVAGIRIIKALSKEDYEKKKFGISNEDMAEQEKKAGMVMAVFNPIMNFCLNGGVVLVVIAGAYRVNSGALQPGKIVAFLTYVTLILNSLLFVSRMFILYSKASASAYRIKEILEAPEEMKVENLPPIDTPYEILFDHVSFSYNKKEKDLDDISFGLKKGETLGIIGATGSGKSTLVQLLMRFYDPDSGCIRIGGRDIRSIEPKELMEKFGVVFQNDFITADTILENIRFGRDLESEAIIHAASYARARDFIESKPGGFTSQVSIKGSNLSGGQKQRLLISRALAAQPEILILDDSSSALDYKTDAALRKELREHFQDTTTVLIAQRISSIMSANAILVLDEGKPVGYGTHEELLAACSIYAEISESQLG